MNPRTTGRIPNRTAAYHVRMHRCRLFFLLRRAKEELHLLPFPPLPSPRTGCASASGVWGGKMVPLLEPAGYAIKLIHSIEIRLITKVVGVKLNNSKEALFHKQAR